MKKVELVEAVAAAAGLTKTDAAKVIDATFAAITEALVKGDKVPLVGFGTFEVRQRAVRRTIARKLSLARNYSIHELVAEIEMFIRDNEDDELVEDDVMDLAELKEELKRNYVVIDYKVESIIEKREGKNLPLDKRLSKRAVIEIETYRFLNKYGYDVSTPGFVEEPKYQDTMANEIARIVEYINSADIL